MFYKLASGDFPSEFRLASQIDDNLCPLTKYWRLIYHFMKFSDVRYSIRMRHMLARLIRSGSYRLDDSEFVRLLEGAQHALPAPNYFDSPSCGHQLLEFVPTREQQDAALQTFLPAVTKSYVDLVARGTSQVSKSERGHLQDGLFEKSGLSTISLPSPRFRVIQYLLEPVFESLVASIKTKRENGQKLKFPDYVVDLDQKSDSFREIRNLLIEAGIFALIDSREARPVELTQVALQFSDRERTLGEYGKVEDDGLPVHKSAYWHIDSSTSIRTKLLVYMNDVTREQGPFLYCPSSHHLPGIEELAIRKTNDLLRLTPKEFVSLPSSYQMHALFGDHMTEADEQLDSFLCKEIEVVGAAGTAVLFDVDGVHRGGFVRSGARRMLQCNFSVKY